MITRLISLIIFFVIGWVIYTQIFGTTEEQQMGQEVISNAKETAKGVFQIFKHESGKIKEGTYDESIDKLGALLDELRQKAKESGDEEELTQLAQETKRLKDEVAKAKESGNEESLNEEQTKEDLKKLAENVQSLIEKME